jgi:hypothetical protein
MKKLLSGMLCLAAFTATAQYTDSENFTAAELLSEITGTGVILLNPVLSCGDTSNGKFSGTGYLDFDSGIILSTNNASDCFPFETGMPYYEDSKMYTEVGMDPDIQAYIDSRGNYEIECFNACVLEFDVLTQHPQLSLDAIFASSELNFGDGYGGISQSECDFSGDVPVVLIKGGTEYPEYKQVFTYPGTDAPVNGTTLSYDGPVPPDTCTSYFEGTPFLDYYVRNYYPDIVTTDINYRFFTKNIPVTTAVTPCDTYHLKIGIADVRAYAWRAYGSSIFIKTGSVRGTGQPDDCGFTSANNPSIEQISLSIVPNPSTAGIQVVLTGVKGNPAYHAVITNTMGKPVFSAQGDMQQINNELDNCNLPSGIYLLQLTDTEGKNTFREKISRK